MYRFFVFLMVLSKLLFVVPSYANNEEMMCLPVIVDGKEVPVVFTTRIYDAVVSFNWSLKDSFCYAFKEQQGPVFLTEYIPRGQTLSNWQEMFSISAFYDSVVSNHQLIKGYTSNSFNCKTYKYIVSKETKDSLELTSVCGSYRDQRLTNNTDISETTHYLVKKTSNATYTFFYSKRGKPFDASKYDFKNDNIKKWSAFLNTIELIPTKSPHP